MVKVLCQHYYICRPSDCTEPIFENLLRSPRIDSQPGGPVRQPYLSSDLPGYIGWRNRFLGIYCWAPETFKNTSSVLRQRMMGLNPGLLRIWHRQLRRSNHSSRSHPLCSVYSPLFSVFSRLHKLNQG